MSRSGFDDLPGKPGMLLLERSYGGFVLTLAQRTSLLWLTHYGPQHLTIIYYNIRLGK